MSLDRRDTPAGTHEVLLGASVFGIGVAGFSASALLAALAHAHGFGVAIFEDDPDDDA